MFFRNLDFLYRKSYSNFERFWWLSQDLVVFTEKWSCPTSIMDCETIFLSILENFFIKWRYDKTVQETPVANTRVWSVHKLPRIACRHPSYSELLIELRGLTQSPPHILCSDLRPDTWDLQCFLATRERWARGRLERNNVPRRRAMVARQRAMAAPKS